MIRVKITFPDFARMAQGTATRLTRAVTAAANMAASMILEAGRADISSAGKFGRSWVSGLKMNVQGAMGNMTLFLTHDIPFASIFETGGVIHGSPLLWIPLSGTDAAGIKASAFPGGLRGRRQGSGGTGRPLLFSAQDKKPRYFGIESVTIPKKFHLTQDVVSVMANFRAVFDDAWKASA